MGRHGTIANRKDKQDAKRAQVFTKYARLITVAAKEGGDPVYNVALENAINKAKAINMPNDNIQRAIKKGTGELEGESYESHNYEGYGPGGVAIIVEALTDNKNRTSSHVKHYFDKFGGNLGVPGCVSYMFERKGYLLIERTDEISEDELMEVALEAEMEDMATHDDSFEIFTSTDNFDDVKSALSEAGHAFVEADIELIASIDAAPLSGGDKKQLIRLINILEDDDDVQKVYHNCVEDLEEE
ncbi:MAG: YebC/PmpR family DNA-binding transcriptional regulator [Clostridia bacterium]|nr:YebC/PmpR family DNA-binding transcriptional regulator [Clostridia bacterium]